jgi:hypothetical protein
MNTNYRDSNQLDRTETEAANVRVMTLFVVDLWQYDILVFMKQQTFEK